MSIIFKTEDRRIIPRLRSFDLALSTGELRLDGKATNIVNPYDRVNFLNEQKRIWNSNKNLSFAGDILGSAFVLGLEDEFHDIATYVLNQAATEDEPLAKLAKKIVEPHSYDSQINPAAPTTNFNRSSIAVLKSSLNKEPKNPIAWMELGRLYALEGQQKKAEKAINLALSLDKNNRFIVRSASRFFHHFSHDTQKSLHVIRNAEYSKSDPWLLSADIAYSQVLNRFSKMIKIGESYVKKHSGDIFSITELTSALGTVEFNDGHIKEAKKYFRQALSWPTDNSLAQVNWMAENIGGFNVDTLSYQVPLAYEAKAIYYYEQGVFDEAYKESIKWQEDEPFSIRPIKAASYISSFFYKDYQTSIALTRKGLQIKPNEVVLSNNLVYYLLQDGKLDEAIPLFEKTIRNVILKPDHYPESEQLYCNATAGLIFFKQNQAELGKLYYNKAIDIAKKMKNGYLIALAVVNYTKAALNFADDDDANSLIKQLKDTCKYITAEDIKFMYNEILKDYYRAETHG